MPFVFVARCSPVIGRRLRGWEATSVTKAYRGIIGGPLH